MAAVDPDDLIFLDETSTPITLTPLRARAPRGQRAVGRIPRGKRPPISWLATLTPAGLGASVLLEGAIDGAAFVRFVAQLLVPRLRPGQVVVWDNRNVHKRTTAREHIAAAGGRVVFLPSSSPDCNPIEQACAKTKQALRRIGPRSWDTVLAAVGEVLVTVTAADARAFFAEAGFPLPDHDTT